MIFVRPKNITNMEKLPHQLRFRPVLPEVIGNVDYKREKDLLIRIDELLILSGLEQQFVETSLEQWLQAEDGKKVGANAIRKRKEHSKVALRCMVLCQLLGMSYRETSQRLAECPLFQWFCGLDHLGVVQVPAKSSLHRYHQWVSPEVLNDLNRQLIELAAQAPEASEAQALELKNTIELDTIWLDSTALKAKIHHPVDWVLLRDATRTLMLATQLIRKHGLKHRMKDPMGFLSQMNGLCMAMTAARRQKKVKRSPKQVLRQMKRLLRIARDHALRHRDLLDQRWEETDWTRAQADQVLGRMDNVLLQLPAAIEQAHRRMIREEKVPNAKKILSLYDPDVQVIVRGKASAKVEFGNTLVIAEQTDGLIIDWRFLREASPGDSQELRASLASIEEHYGQGRIRAVSADRQFDNEENRALLKTKKIYNGLCPRDPKDLSQRSRRTKFRQLQKRRAQTEGRISILKNSFLGEPMKERGFAHREQRVAWGILSHNLWRLARLEPAQEESPALEEAALGAKRKKSTKVPRIGV